MLMDLQSIYSKYSAPDKGGDKGTLHSYIDTYATLIPTTTTSLLEIGVYEGHSLAMWQEYLPEAKVIGFDIDTSRVKFEVDARRIDATNGHQIKTSIHNASFDVIIDDGSHRVYDQMASFDLLFSAVNTGGLYIIEDVQGPDALRLLTDYIEKRTKDYSVYDFRGVKGRYDDILIVVRR